MMSRNLFNQEAANYQPLAARMRPSGLDSYLGQEHLLAKGIIDTQHVIYYLSVIAFGLFLTARSVDADRWRG